MTDYVRKVGSDVEDAVLKRDPWRALVMAAEMNKGTPDDNPAAHYWSLAAYAWHAEHDRVSRRYTIVLTLLFVTVVGLACCLGLFR